MSDHLSEICKSDEIDAVLECLKRLCPGRAVVIDASSDLKEDEDGGPTLFCQAANISFESHIVAQHSFGGAWSHQDDDGRTALHWAVAMQSYSLAGKLMSAPYHALVYSVDHDGASPFLTACMVGTPIQFLTTILSKAAEQRRWNVAQQLFWDSKRGEASVNTEEPLAEHRIAVVNQPDNSGNTPLLHAASRGRLTIVSFLLQSGAFIAHTNKRGQSALHRAIGRGSLDVVEELVGASRKRHTEVEHKRWINLQDYRGDTALFYASMDNNEELGRYLLRQGADRNVRNKEGKEFWEV